MPENTKEQNTMEHDSTQDNTQQQDIQQQDTQQNGTAEYSQKFIQIYGLNRDFQYDYMYLISMLDKKTYADPSVAELLDIRNQKIEYLSKYVHDNTCQRSFMRHLFRTHVIQDLQLTVARRIQRYFLTGDHYTTPANYYDILEHCSLNCIKAVESMDYLFLENCKKLYAIDILFSEISKHTCFTEFIVFARLFFEDFFNNYTFSKIEQIYFFMVKHHVSHILEDLFSREENTKGFNVRGRQRFFTQVPCLLVRDIIDLYELDRNALITFLAVINEIQSNKTNRSHTTFNKEMDQFMDSLFFRKVQVFVSGKRYMSIAKHISIDVVRHFNQFCGDPYNPKFNRQIDETASCIDFKTDWYNPKILPKFFEEVVLKLQNPHNLDYHILDKKDAQKAISDANGVCLICQGSLTPAKCVQFKACKHVICRACNKQYAEQRPKYTYNCPYCNVFPQEYHTLKEGAQK